MPKRKDLRRGIDKKMCGRKEDRRLLGPDTNRRIGAQNRPLKGLLISPH